MNVDLKDVREYLLETNAMEEAESIVLHNILKKSNESLKKKVVRDSLNAATESKIVHDNVEKLDNLRISDLLGSLEQEFERSEKQKRAVPPTIPDNVSVTFAEKQTKQLEQMKLFDEVASQELSELEKKRDWVQLKKLANKYELDKLNIVNKPAEVGPVAQHHAAKSAPIPFPKNTKETMGKLYELTEEHARKMAENRAQALAFQREREQLNKGNWSLRTSYLSNAAALRDVVHSVDDTHGDSYSGSGANSKQPFAHAAAEAAPKKAEYTAPVPNATRLQAILMSVATNDAMEAQRREIDALRQQASQADQSLRADPVLRDMNAHLHRAREAGNDSPDPNNSGSNHVVDRRMSVPQYLNKWLKIPEPEPPVAGIPTANHEPFGPPEQPRNSRQLPNVGTTANESAPVMNAMSTHRPSAQNLSVALVPSEAADPTQALIAKLLEENRKLQEEKEVLQRSQQLSQQPELQLQSQPPVKSAPVLRSPERAQRGMGSGGALDQFRNRSYGQQQQPVYYQQPQFPSDPYSAPYRPSGPAAAPFAPYGAYPPHMQQGPPSQQQQPFPGFPQYPPPYGAPLQDPQQQQQQQALAQLQQMAEQMERENSKMMAQLGMASSSPERPPPFGAAGGGGGNSNHALLDPQGRASHDAGDGRRGIVDNAQLLTLERDKHRNEVKPSRAELRHQEEVRKIQHEIEKIKYQSELDIAQAEYEQSRSKRLKELEHEKWMQQQKQDLQALKIQQVLAKEQRMLRLHQEDGASGTGDDAHAAPRKDSGKGSAGAKDAVGVPQRSSSALAREHVREECGVGRVPMPLDLATGITIIVDGIILPRPMQEGNLFRIALGLFDKAGKALVRLTASQWQSWSPATANDKQDGAVQLTKELLTRTLKLSETKVDLANARCLLELQTKDSLEGGQKGAGWAVMPVICSALGRQAVVNTVVSKENVVLCNNAWRAVLRKSLSDPAIPDLFAPPEQAVFESWFLVRILDSSAKQQASSWTLGDSLCRTEKQALELYVDVMGAQTVDTHKVNDSQKLLEKDPEIKGLFHSGSKSPMGFSTRGSATDLQNPGGDAAAVVPPGGPQMKGAVAAMKAVGLFKSRSKSNMKGGLPNIAEEGQASDRLGSMSRKPSMSVPQSARLGSASMSGFDGLSRKAPGGATDVVEAEDKSKELLRAADDKKYWFLGKPLGPCSDKYQKGDGVDIYIDSAMFLPDNCTLSRITMRVFASDKEQVGSVHECFSLPNSPSAAPVFKFKAELRMSSFNMTSTALIRIDTVDAATLLPASVGYCCIKLFASREREQPSHPAQLNACVNTGHFQIPLHAGRIPTSLGVMSETMLSTLPKIPAASLLVRILPAPKSADGISTLSRNEFPTTEWARLGLDVPAPTYVSGEYSGGLCEPTDLELVSYRAKAQHATESVESALLQAISARPSEAIGLPPKPTGSEPEALMSWLKQLLPPHDQMRRSIEYAYAVPYSVETGLNVAVDRLYNMPDAGIFTSHSTMYKVITSMSPPGLFYKDPPLYDGVHYTRTHTLEAHMRAPGFADGFFDFVPSTLNSSLYLILDIRTIRIEAKKAGQDPKITLEPPSERKSYWSLLPLSMEKIPGQGHRYISSGVYHLPLIEGTVPAEDIFRAANPYKELCSRLSAKGKGPTHLKVMDGGGMVAVRVLNPLLKELVTPDMTGAKPIIHTEFMEDLLTHAITGFSGSGARIDKFTVDATKLQVGGTNGGKSTATQLPKSCQADLPALVRAVNKEFETATGLVSR